MNFIMHFDHLFGFKIDYKNSKHHLTSAVPSVVSAIPVGAIPPVAVSPVSVSGVA